MRLLKINTFWQLCKWIAIVLALYAIAKTGISPSMICILLLIRLLVRLGLQLIGGIIQIAFVFLILWLVTFMI